MMKATRPSKAIIEYKDALRLYSSYEYYNKEISAWAKNMGIQVINYTLVP